MSLNPVRQTIEAEALSWVGTPYAHYQRCKGRSGGVDCIQLVIGIAENTMLIPYGITVPYYSPQWHLHQKDELLANTVVAHGCREKALEDRQLGDLLLFRFRPEQPCSHSAIYISESRMVHAFFDGHGGARYSRVIVHKFAHQWHLLWAARCFALPQVED